MSFADSDVHDTLAPSEQSPTTWPVDMSVLTSNSVHLRDNCGDIHVDTLLGRLFYGSGDIVMELETTWRHCLADRILNTIRSCD